MDEIDKLIARTDGALTEFDQEQDGAAAPGGQPGQEPVPIPTNADAVGSLLMMGREMAVQAFDLQSPRTTLNDQNVKLCAGAIGPALDHYGINLGGTVATNPALNAVMVAGPILWEAAKALRIELEQRREKVSGLAAPVYIPPHPSNVVSMADVADMKGPNG